MRFFRNAEHPSDETLSARIDGQAGVSERARIDAHVAGCARCRDALDGMRAVRSALAALPRQRAPRSFALREADVRPEPRAPARGLGWASPVLSGVASLALVAFLTLVSIDAFGGGTTGGAGGDTRSSGDGAAATAGAFAPLPGAESTGNDGDNQSAEDNTFSGGEFCVTATCANDSARDYNALLLRDATIYGPPRPGAFGPPRPPSLPATRGPIDEGESNTALRIAEGAAAATALVSIAGLALLWSRRRLT